MADTSGGAAGAIASALVEEETLAEWSWAAVAGRFAALGCASSSALAAGRRRRGGRRAAAAAVGGSAARRAPAVARPAVELPVRDAPVETTVAIPGANVQEDAKQKKADQYRLLLFNDPLNKREFVARCLMTICLLKESDSYQVMMKAHKEGVAIIGVYQFETAEAYCEGLKAKGLTVDIIPLETE